MKKETVIRCFCFYAFDVGPKKNLEMVAKEARRNGYEVKLLEDSDSLPEIPGTCLITGLSSFKNERELFLGAEAKNAGALWFMIADAHRSWARPSAKGRVGNAILFIASPFEIPEAIAFGYRKAVYVGGPPLWQEFFKINSFPSPSDAPNKILVGGIKDGNLTNKLLEQTTVAANQLFGSGWTLIFRPHPREEEINPEKRKSILSRVTVITDDVSTSDWISIADLSIFTSGATGTIEAAYKRKPVIYYEDKDVKERMIAQTGSPDWFPAEAGACVKARHDDLKEKIEFLFTKRGSQKLIKVQKKFILSLFQKRVWKKGFWIIY